MSPNRSLPGRCAMRILLLAFAFLATFPAHGAGSAEASRDATMDIVESGSFVATSYIDLGSILDEYHFPYHSRPDSTLSVFVDREEPVIPAWGDTTVVQVSMITNSSDYFPEIAVEYVVFPYSEELFSDAGMVAGLKSGLRSILRSDRHGQRIWVYLRQDRELVQLTSAGEIDSLVERAGDQFQTDTAADAAMRLTEAERDLQRLLEAAADLPGKNPRKCLWILDKPIATSAKDFSDVSATIAGYGEADTEISFCGHGPTFRANTVNTFVEQFGGNSYYVTDGSDLAETVQKDFDFYRRPAVSDLVISVHQLGANPDPAPVLVYRQKTMGPDESHVVVAELLVPSRLEFARETLASRGAFTAEDVTRQMEAATVYPAAYITVCYFDHATGTEWFEGHVVTLEYTEDYAAYMAARSPEVLRNLAILDTYRLYASIAPMLSYGNYTTPLIQINSHIGRLTRINLSARDELIAEDIEFLRRYKQIILENRNNPLRGLKAWQDLNRRRY